MINEYMKRILVGICLCVACCTYALPPHESPYLDSVILQVRDQDTFYLAQLQTVYVFADMKFKNKKQERFYWRTVRDVKKTLPISKILTLEMVYADEQLAKITDKKLRKKWWKQHEKYLFKKYEQQFRKMTAAQGQMLMKLMDRESDRTSYQIIYHYRGKASANFWQFIAKLFKNDLKEEYDANDKDYIVERIIYLVETGQL